MSSSLYKRMAQLLFHFWPYIIISSISAIIFVLLNSTSMWLVASLINNVLTDFDKIVESQMEWASRSNLTMNEKLKYWTNVLILRDTPANSLKVLCITLLSVFFTKNIFLYIKNILLRIVELKLVKDIRDRLYKHIQTLSLGYFHKKQTGKQENIRTKIIDTIGKPIFMRWDARERRLYLYLLSMGKKPAGNAI